jgi:hypothetical protein
MCFEGVSALKRSAFLQWWPTSTLQSWGDGEAGSIGADKSSIPPPERLLLLLELSTSVQTKYKTILLSAEIIAATYDIKHWIFSKSRCR